jgi:hypothetical protein
MEITTTYVSLLLDESGSMAPLKADTIGGFNQYLASLQDPTAGEVLFTFIKFDSSAITKVHVGIPVQAAVPLTPETYTPRASTPLIDATYKTIIATAAAVAKRTDAPQVLVVIQTDGQENASTEFTNADLNALIKEKTALGWQFVFLGAGIDAFAQASQWGIQGQQTLSYARDKSAATFLSLHSNTTSYRMTGQAASLAFTPEQRTAAGDPGAPAPATAPPLPAPPTPAAPAGRRMVDDFTLDPAE